MLQDTADKLAASETQPVEAAIAEVKKAIDGGDTAAIKQAMDRLNTAQHKAAEALYKEAQAGRGTGTAQPPPDSGTSGNGEGGEVIDAEVVEEEKK